MAIDKVILEHEHEEIKAIRPTWKRVKTLVEEVEKDYAEPDFFLTLPNEDANQKRDRKAAFLTGFYNPSQELISVMGQYVLRRGVTRVTNSEDIERLFQSADRGGQSLNDFMRTQVSPLLKAYGTVFAVVDKPRGVFVNKADERERGMPYLSVLHPDQVLDFDFGDDGKLLWFRYTQSGAQKRNDPFPKIQSEKVEYVTWTTTTYFRHDENGNEIESFDHGFGVVPIVIQASFLIDPGKTIGKATFFASSRYLVMGNNLRSIADVEVMKYGSVLLANVSDVDTQVRVQPINPDTGLPVMSVKRDEAKSIVPIQDMTQKPEYLTKDIEVVTKAQERADMYFAWAFETEATGKAATTATSVEGQGSPQSGVAKAYDFADMDSALYDHAMDLRAFEAQVILIWASILKLDTKGTSSTYPTSFDVRSFADKIQQIRDLMAIRHPSKTAMIAAYKRISGDISQDDTVKAVIDAEIDQGAVSAQESSLEAAKAAKEQIVPK